LRGEIHLQNAGEQRLVFRGAEMHSLEAPKGARAARAKGPVETEPLRQRLPSVIVHPGEKRRVPLKLALAPTTPPGEYQAEIQLKDSTWPVIMHVTEKVALSISPSRLVIQNTPGATETRRVVLSNQGNVPITIGELAAIPLDDDLLQCRLLRAVVAALGEEQEQTLDTILTEFAHQSKSILQQSGLLRVRNRTGRLTLEPGQVSPVDLEFRLPETLDRRTRYRALVPILTADLEVLIAPALEAVQIPEKPEKPARPTRTPRGKAARS
jgi:hypothetical protein